MKEKTFIEIVNWREFQHYKGRKPPWIKLYHALLDNYDYCCLDDSSKLLLITLYMLAAKTENRIPSDSKWIQSKGSMVGDVNLQPLLDAGFVVLSDVASVLLATCKQDASKTLARCLHQTETETDTDTETEKEKYARARATPPRKSNGKLSKANLELFEIWYRRYPKKVGRGAAERAWSKHEFTAESVKAMVDALEWQTEIWARDNFKYAPNPATYLNEKRWLDEKIKEHGHEYHRRSAHNEIPF